MTCTTLNIWPGFYDLPTLYPTMYPSDPDHQSPSEDVARGSDARKTIKKRPSRAGTRSVSNLTPLQLERKRANDRDAQRAIRLRTKEQLSAFQQTINGLQGEKKAKEDLVQATQERNRRLEQEIAYLRGILGDAGYALHVESLERMKPVNGEARRDSRAYSQRDAKSPGSYGEYLASMPTSSANGAALRSPSFRARTCAPHDTTFTTMGSDSAGLPLGTEDAGATALAGWRPYGASRKIAGTMGPLTAALPAQSPGSYLQGESLDWPGSSPQHESAMGLPRERCQAGTAHSSDLGSPDVSPGYRATQLAAPSFAVALSSSDSISLPFSDPDLAYAAAPLSAATLSMSSSAIDCGPPHALLHSSSAAMQELPYGDFKFDPSTTHHRPRQQYDDSTTGAYLLASYSAA